MHFVIHALDRPGALARRLEVIGAHRAYLAQASATNRMKILLSGPLIDDETGQMKGSFFLIDAPGRAEVDAFLADDPLANADVWADCTVTAFHLRTSAMGET